MHHHCSSLRNCQLVCSTQRRVSSCLFVGLCLLHSFCLVRLLDIFPTWYLLWWWKCWRTDAFELWCWRRLLRGPWTARKSNQSILKEISLDYSLEGLMLKLKLQYLGHLRQRANSLEKTLMLGKIEGRRRRGWQRIRWLDDITISMDMNRSKLREIVKGREAWHAAAHRVAKSWTQLSGWTTAMMIEYWLIE